MDLSEAVSNTVNASINIIHNQTTTTTSANSSNEGISSIANEHHQGLQTNNELTLIRIDQINTDITFLWKIQAVVSCEYPKRTFINTHGSGEISNWDLTDQSGSITLVAFNLDSYLMSHKLKKDKAYEITNLSIRPVSDAFKTLPHAFQLVCNNATRIEEIALTSDYQEISYVFTHLNQVESIPLNSIIDVQVHILRDYGISTGTRNDNIWSRRNLHIDQDGIHLGMTLWNSQARLIDRNMAGLRIKFKNEKVSWYDGSRVLITMGNTQLSVT